MEDMEDNDDQGITLNWEDSIAWDGWDDWESRTHQQICHSIAKKAADLTTYESYGYKHGIADIEIEVMPMCLKMQITYNDNEEDRDPVTITVVRIATVRERFTQILLALHRYFVPEMEKYE